MKPLIRWAVNNSPAVNTLMVGVLIVGALSLLTMRREEFPEFELDMILVTVPYPGASPAEVEDGICEKVEEAVRSIDGIKKQTSIAQEGAGYLVLELNADNVDTERTLNEVLSEVDRIPSFPELAEDPEVKLITFRQPAIRVGVIGPDEQGLAAELRLRELAERIRYDLLRLDSVSQANIIGAKDYQIDIEISEDTLRKYGLSLRDVAQAVRRENIELPGGTMKSDSQEVLLRGKNKRYYGDQLAKIPLVTQPNGVVLTVGDLGRVRDGFADVTSSTYVSDLVESSGASGESAGRDGGPALVISVDRTSKEDLLKITQEVKQYVQSASMPAGYELKSWADRSVDVRDRLDLLVKNGLQGLALVVIVLAIFLDLRLSFWVALGIPISILGAGAVLLYAGQTLNILSTFAFLMALGIVVDDAIVIGENIYAHRQRDKDYVNAAIDGTLEVLPSVVASVTTTIIAFLPLMFVAGLMGKFIALMPVAVIAMLVISLVESTFILPCHLAHSHHGASGEPDIADRVRRFCGELAPLWRWSLGAPLLVIILAGIHLFYPLKRLADLFGWLNAKTAQLLRWSIARLYVPTLSWSFHHPAIVVSTSLSVLMISLGFVRAGITPFIVFPKLDSNEINAKVVYPDGTSGVATDRATRRLEQAIAEVNRRYAIEHGGERLVKLIQRSVGEVSSPGALGPNSRTAGSHVGMVEVELVGTEERVIDSQQAISLWRAAAGEFPGAEEVSFGTPQRGPTGKAIEFKLLADAASMAELEEAVEKTKARLAEYPGVFDLSDDSRPGKWEFQLRIKPFAEAMGIQMADLAETVRSSYYGEEVMRLQRGRHEVKLMVRYPWEDRRSLANFHDIRVRTGDGAERPLTELADVNVERGYSEINRVDQQRSITITGDVDEVSGNADAIVRALQTDFLPKLIEQHPDVGVRWEGQKEQTDESVSSMIIGFMVALIAMFVLLTIEFRSYLQPLIILAIVPFGAVGAIWGHALMGLPITMFTLFGLVALTGVVVNDSIVLIDFINHRVGQGKPLDVAIVEAGRRRFRPVLLTSITTIAGLTPLLLETSFQAQMLIPMAATLVFGLSVATSLVLILIPTYYYIYARIAFKDAPAEPVPVELKRAIDPAVGTMHEPVISGQHRLDRV